MRIKTLSRLLKYTRSYSFYMILALVSAILSVASALYIPILAGKSIDYAISSANVDYNKIWENLIQIAISTLVVALFQWILNISTNIISYSTITDIRNQAFSKLHDLPLKYIDSNQHGDIINRIINDVEQVSIGLIQGFQKLFSGIITIAGTIIFMISINLGLSLVVIILTPISLGFSSMIAKGCHKMFKSQSVISGELTGYVEEMITNQKVVKAFNYEKRSEEKFKKINNKLERVGIKAQFFSAMVNPCTRFINGLVYSSVGIVGALISVNSGLKIGDTLLFEGALTVGALSSFLTYASQYTKPFNEISSVVTELQNAFASLERVFEIIDEKKEIDNGRTMINNVIGNVFLDHISFSYEKDKPLIKDYSLNVLAGKRIAIVGPTGCGKTTIINLLMRFYDVLDGKITVDNTDIKDIPRANLRENYGMVLQETWMFEGTVYENIAYGKKDASKDEVIEAAKKTHAHAFIERLPKGYDTIISDDGGISLGEKQLLSIARVMLNIPPMLILDEATSSIDTRTEQKIQDAFKVMMEGKTSFIIAHRLSTIENADLIIVMNRGSIIESGTHEELLNKKGFYYNLYNSQFEE